EETGLMVVAIKDATNGSFVYNPKSDYVFHGDDTLIVIGNPKQVHKLNGLIAGNNC
ncbi:MAG: TrkA C-terminal domain-containing protein, partial [Elusimicrobia bacterium]|nr:TrkA C-terminal domain-containing protein [Elusimicrobiota bacterium]